MPNFGPDFTLHMSKYSLKLMFGEIYFCCKHLLVFVCVYVWVSVFILKILTFNNRPMLTWLLPGPFNQKTFLSTLYKVTAKTLQQN